jgi:hypothetical protein
MSAAIGAVRGETPPYRAPSGRSEGRTGRPRRVQPYPSRNHQARTEV